MTRQFLPGHGVALAGAHDVADGQEEGAANGAGGMVFGVVLLPKAARLQDRHGQRVAQHQHGGGAGGGGQVERAGLAGDLDVEHHVAVFRQRGFERAGERNDFDREPFQRGKQVQQLLRRARITQRQHHVPIVDQAEVAVEGVHGVEDDAGGAGAGERGGDLLADVAGFADAHHDDLAPLLERFDEDFDRDGEGAVQLRPHGLEGLQFDVEDFVRAREMIHGLRMPACGGIFNLDFAARRMDVVLVARKGITMRNITLLCCLLAVQTAFAQPPVERAARADNAFGFKLMAETRKALPGSNVFQSPVGLALALAMVENGAKGETLSQMAQTLQREGVTPDQYNEANKSLMGQLLAPGQKCTLEIANGIWTLEGANIKPAFVTSAQNTYQAEAASVNFQDAGVVKKINDWVSGKTHGKIPDMVKAPLERDLRVIVMDAIYFKGAWAEPFDKKLTRDLAFTLANGTSVTHPRMSQTGKLAYFENASFQGVILPYAGRQISLVVLLPKEGLDKLLQELTPENWEQWMRQFRSRQGTVELPRFKLENTYDLKDELRAMGMTRAFTTEADFSGISDERLLISWVKQKTFVEVNEEGTEAAAVSGIGISAMLVQARPEPPFTMIVDRPFYAAIRDNNTGTILFHGAIFDPR